LDETRAVTLAEKVVLHCPVSGDPPLTIIWMKNGRTVLLDDRISQLRNGSLVIYDSVVSIFYRCLNICFMTLSEVWGSHVCATFLRKGGQFQLRISGESPKKWLKRGDFVGIPEEVKKMC
jgi:hypothetical protein